MFSPIVSAPLTWFSGRAARPRAPGHERVVLGDEVLGALLEGGAVVVGPPVVQQPVAVEAAALVVEAVADLVADDRADAAVVRRGVALGVEERVLQDRRGEHDLVHQRVVVRVDGLRRHVPLVAVDRLADLVELAVVLPHVRAADVADEVAGVDLERRVVLPLHRVPDLRGEGVELRERALAGLGGHPLELGDRLAVRLDEVGDQLVHRDLRGRREVPLDVDAADRLAQRGLGEADAALPALAVHGDAGELRAVEREVLGDELVRQERRRRVDDREPQPRLPVLEALLDEQRAEALDEARLVDVDLGERVGVLGRDALDATASRSTPTSACTSSQVFRL